MDFPDEDIETPSGGALAEELAGLIERVARLLAGAVYGRVLREGYDASKLVRGLRALIDQLKLDVLLIDTHPGINEETLLSIAMSHILAVVLRPESQDYEGTAITVEVARQLEVPNLMLVVNKVPATFDRVALKSEVEKTYDCPLCHCEGDALSAEAISNSTRRLLRTTSSQ